jgi:hypothetical protein
MTGAVPAGLNKIEEAALLAEVRKGVVSPL